MFCCSDKRGQASVEAAALLPILCIMAAILLQPICVLYTRMVMASAASETVRVVLTGQSLSEADVVNYCKRRLAAVPEIPIFHSGGSEDWQVTFSDGDEIAVHVKGHVKAIPFMSWLLSAFSASDSEGIVLEARAQAKLRPQWLEGSYESWQGIWN